MKIYSLFLLMSSVAISFFQEEWKAPKSADSLENPVSLDSKSIEAGMKIFKSVCWTCHGMEGKGDGPVAANMKPFPADLSSESVQSQSDGAIYWKISEGRGMMAPYKKSLSAVQRWQLVNFLRSLKNSGHD